MKKKDEQRLALFYAMNYMSNEELYKHICKRANIRIEDEDKNKEWKMFLKKIQRETKKEYKKSLKISNKS